jgi:hypothetical protein
MRVVKVRRQRGAMIWRIQERCRDLAPQSNRGLPLGMTHASLRLSTQLLLLLVVLTISYLSLLDMAAHVQVVTPCRHCLLRAWLHR